MDRWTNVGEMCGRTDLMQLSEKDTQDDREKKKLKRGNRLKIK